MVEAPSFHPIIGPILFVSLALDEALLEARALSQVIYACLSNTLLTTVLVSILTLTFANISQDAIAEGLYRRTVVIFQGIKSDGLFNYQVGTGPLQRDVMLKYFSPSHR